MGQNAQSAKDNSVYFNPKCNITLKESTAAPLSYYASPDDPPEKPAMPIKKKIRYRPQIVKSHDEECVREKRRPRRKKFAGKAKDYVRESRESNSASSREKRGSKESSDEKPLAKDAGESAEQFSAEKQRSEEKPRQQAVQRVKSGENVLKNVGRKTVQKRTEKPAEVQVTKKKSKPYSGERLKTAQSKSKNDELLVKFEFRRRAGDERKKSPERTRTYSGERIESAQSDSKSDEVVLKHDTRQRAESGKRGSAEKTRTFSGERIDSAQSNSKSDELVLKYDNRRRAGDERRRSAEIFVTTALGVKVFNSNQFKSYEGDKYYQSS